MYCGNLKAQLIVDHFTPIYLGGRTEIGNLVPVCPECNKKKYRKQPDEWISSEFGREKLSEIKRFLSEKPS